jgi:hypothetical protein
MCQFFPLNVLSYYVLKYLRNIAIVEPRFSWITNPPAVHAAATEASVVTEHLVALLGLCTVAGSKVTVTPTVESSHFSCWVNPDMGTLQSLPA